MNFPFFARIIASLGIFIIPIYVSLNLPLTLTEKIFIWIISVILSILIVYNLIINENKSKLILLTQIVKQNILEIQSPQFSISDFDRSGTLKQFFKNDHKFEKEGKYLDLINQYKKYLLTSDLKIEDKVDINIIIGNCYYFLNDFSEAKKIYTIAKRISRHIKDTNTRLRRQAAIYDCIGLIYQNQAQFKKAIRFHEEAAERFKKLKHDINLAISLNNLGQIHYELGNTQLALDCFERVLKIFQVYGTKVEMGITMNKLGSIYCEIGDFQKGLDYKENSLKILKKFTIMSFYSHYALLKYSKIGQIYKERKENYLAITYFKKTLKKANKLQKIETAYVYLSIGNTYLNLRNYAEALNYYQKALDIFKKIGHKIGTAKILNKIGNIYLNKKNYAEASNYYQVALDIFTAVGHKLGSIEVLNNMGLLFLRLKKIDETLENYEKALNICKEIGLSRKQALIYKYIGDVYSTLEKKYNFALDNYKNALQLDEENNIVLRVALDYKYIGNTYLRMEQCKNAKNYYNEAFKIYDKDKDHINSYYFAEILFGIGKCNYNLGIFNESINFFMKVYKICKKNKNKKYEILRAKSIVYLGAICHERSLYNYAIDWLTDALAIYKKYNDYSGMINVFNALGNDYICLKKYEDAIKYLRNSNRLIIKYNNLDNRKNKIWFYIYMHYLNLTLKRYRKSLYYVKKALIICKTLKNKQLEGIVFWNLAEVYRKLNEIDKSLEFAKKALIIYKRLDLKTSIVRGFKAIGNCYYKKKYYDKAIINYADALEIYGQLKNIIQIAECLKWIGFSYYHLEQYELAITYFKEAIDSCKQSGQDEKIAECLKWIGFSYYHLEQYELAITYFKEAIDSCKQSGQDKKIAECLKWVINSYYHLNQFKLAILNYKNYKEALEISNRIENIEVNLYFIIGICYLHLKKRKETIFYLREFVKNSSDYNEAKQKIVKNIKKDNLLFKEIFQNK